MSVALSMGVVFLGGALSAIPVHGSTFLTFPGVEEMLAYVLGLLAVVASALCQAGRMAYQEVAFAAYTHVTALQLTSFSAVFSAAAIAAAAAAAQALPGADHGRQARDRPRPCPAPARPAHAIRLSEVLTPQICTTGDQL